MVWGQASRPLPTRARRMLMISSIVVCGSRFGLVCGRRDRGVKAASPSSAYRLSSRISHPEEDADDFSDAPPQPAGIYQRLVVVSADRCPRFPAKSPHAVVGLHTHCPRYCHRRVGRNWQGCRTSQTDRRWVSRKVDEIRVCPGGTRRRRWPVLDARNVSPARPPWMSHRFLVTPPYQRKRPGCQQIPM
jgi:hypothetical protein